PRRDPRRTLAVPELDADLVGICAEIELSAADLRDLREQLRFEAGQRRVALHVPEDRQPGRLVLVAGRGEVDEIVVLGPERRQRPGDPACGAPNADVDVSRGLDAKPPIADLERARREMRAVRVKLLGRGHALGPCGIDGDDDVRRQPADHGRRDARRGLRVRRAVERLVPHTLDARAERCAPRPDIAVLEHEYARRAALDRRDERLFADRLELARAELRAERAGPFAPRRVRDLVAALVRVVPEARRGVAAFDLEMLVIADAEPKLDARELRQPEPFAAQVDARRVEIDSHALAMRVPGVILL